MFFSFFQLESCLNMQTKAELGELGAVFLSLESGKVDEKVCATYEILSHFTAWVCTVQSTAKWALNRVCVYTRACCVTRVKDFGELCVYV